MKIGTGIQSAGEGAEYSLHSPAMLCIGDDPGLPGCRRPWKGKDRILWIFCEAIIHNIYLKDIATVNATHLWKL